MATPFMSIFDVSEAHGLHFELQGLNLEPQGLYFELPGLYFEVPESLQGPLREKEPILERLRGQLGTPFWVHGGSRKWYKNGVEKRSRKSGNMGSLGDPKRNPKSVDLSKQIDLGVLRERC